MRSVQSDTGLDFLCPTIQQLNRWFIEAGGNPIPDDLREALLQRQADKRAPKASDNIREPAADYPVRFAFVPDVRAAAGSGAEVFEEATQGTVEFMRSELPWWAKPESLNCIQAVGDSMEPTVQEGNWVVLDLARTEPMHDQLFVIRTYNGLIVKRLRRAGDGWEFVSDNPAYPPRVPGDSDELIGQVAWTGPPRKLVS